MSTLKIPFKRTTLYAVREEGTIYLAAAPIITDLGIERGTQLKRFKSDLFHPRTFTLDTLGGAQKMICLPLDEIGLWLRSINPMKLSNPNSRKKLFEYKKRCVATVIKALDVPSDEELWEEETLDAPQEAVLPSTKPSRNAAPSRLKEEAPQSIVDAKDVVPAREVAFHGNILLTVEVEGVEYVALKPIVEGMGLDWKSQFQKIKEIENYGGITTVLQTHDRQREMLCIPLVKLQGWLFSVNPSKVHPDLKAKVILYQEECFKVLHDYWTRGVVINHRIQEVDIQKAVTEALIAYQQSQAWKTPPTPTVPRMTPEEREIEWAKVRASMQLAKAAVSQQYRELATRLTEVGGFDQRYIQKIFRQSEVTLSGEIIEEKTTIDVSEWLKSKGIKTFAGGASASNFGKIVAKLYRQQRGRDPKKKVVIVNGREMPLNYYESPDDLPLMEDALVEFQKTIPRGSTLPFLPLGRNLRSGGLS